jgi:hypothetical protein
VLLTQEQVTRLRLDDKNQCLQLSAVGCLLTLHCCRCVCGGGSAAADVAPPARMPLSRF